MRSRIAIAVLLASGLLMSGSGAALGVSALSTSNSASEAQYGPVTTTGSSSTSEQLAPSGDDVETLGEPATSDAPASSGRKDATDEPSSTPAAKVQAPRQLEANGRDELPFTGYAAIPLLLGGLILLASGLLIRRGTRRDQA